VGELKTRIELWAMRDYEGLLGRIEQPRGPPRGETPTREECVLIARKKATAYAKDRGHIAKPSSPYHPNRLISRPKSRCDGPKSSSQVPGMDPDRMGGRAVGTP
jgi:hypothetical protein